MPPAVVFRPGVFCGVLISLIVIVSQSANGQKVDLNANGISDVWEWVHGNLVSDPNADPDLDGASNLQESIAGTDPLNGNSSPTVSVSVAGTNLFIGMSGEAG